MISVLVFKNTKHPGANNFSCEKKLVSNLGQGVTSLYNQGLAQPGHHPHWKQNEGEKAEETKKAREIQYMSSSQCSQ